MKIKNIKNVKPSDSLDKQLLNKMKSEDKKYLDGIAALGERKERIADVLRVVGTVAAVIAIVTAVAVWALIGRGIRGTETAIPSENDSTASNTYYVILDTDMDIVEGKDDLQAFFDDYITGKACTLDIFRVNRKEDGKYIGYSMVFNMTENGDGEFYYVTANDAEYTAYGNAEYYAENFLQNPASPLYLPEITFEITENDDYICYTDFGASNCVVLDMSFIENSYENFDKLYDYSKAQAVEIRDGYIQSNEHLLYDFIERYLCGKAAFIKITGDSEITVAYASNSIFSVSINGEDTPNIDELKIRKADGSDYVPDEIQQAPPDGSVIASVDTTKITEVYLCDNEESVPINERETVSIIKLPYEENIYFSDTVIETGNAEYLYGELEYSEMIKKTKDTIAMIKEEVTGLNQMKTALNGYDADFTLHFDSGAEIYLYKNPDGTLDDTVGVSYPGEFQSNVLSYRISDRLLSEFEGGTEEQPQAEVTDPAKELQTLANELNFGYLPSFEAGEAPDYNWMCMLAYFSLDSYPIKGKEFNEFTKKYFDVTYDVEEDYNIPIELGDGYKNYYLSEGCTVSQYCGENVSRTEYEVTLTAYDFDYNETNRNKLNEYLGERGVDDSEEAYHAARMEFLEANGADGLEAEENGTLKVTFTYEQGQLKILAVSGGREPMFDDEYDRYRRIIENYLETEGRYDSIHTHKLRYGEPDENGILKCTLQYTADDKLETKYFLLQDGKCIGTEDV